jgi:CheY-like chemotaxis protein
MSRRILLVDDDEAIRMVAGLALGRVGGYDVETVPSGDEALEVVRRRPPDAIVLDVMMPGMDGPSTLAELRGLPAGRTVPVVFLTASLQPDEVDRLTSLGVAGVLGKPFEPMTLAAELAELLGWPPPNDAGG